MATDKLFTVAGITTHSTAPVTLTKVRFGTDFVRVVKMLTNPKKIFDHKAGLCLTPVRVDFVELPQPMTKLDATRFLASHPDFQSPADQAIIADTLTDREPKPAHKPRAPKAAKPVKVKAAKAKPSLEAIKARKATVVDVLAAVAPSVAAPTVTDAAPEAAL